MDFEPFNIIKVVDQPDFKVEQYDIMFTEDSPEPAVHRGCRVTNDILGINIQIHTMPDFKDNEIIAMALHNTFLEYIKKELI